MSSLKYRKTILREVCGTCEKQIYIGQPIIICEICDAIFHKNCANTKNFKSFREKMYCYTCIQKHDVFRYNPFLDIVNDNDAENLTNEYDDNSDVIETSQKISEILENCKKYEKDEFHNMLNDTNFDSRTHFSILFQNIDGNKSNFDEFTLSLSHINHEFSVIGIAETNTQLENKELYQIPNYTSCYQNKIMHKKKGTGVALYINNMYNSSKCTQISKCTPHIESLFVELTNTEKPITVGVIYRPPSGSVDTFNSELKNIINYLNTKNAYIMGDYNINLHNMQDTASQEYEELILSQGLFPLISIATHEKPNCQKTCIDNIICNSLENVVITGAIPNHIGHHHPIFTISSIKNPNIFNNEKLTIYYEYSQENLSELNEELKNTTEKFNDIPCSFEKFNNVFHQCLDKTCKLEKPKITKRNRVTNPWITRGLINAIAKKDRLYKNWKKSINRKNKHGDTKLYEQYKTHRKIVKNLIIKAKKSHYSKEFEKHSGNSKKTWEIINKLRGKNKNNLKPSFVIDNERIICRRIIADKFNNYFVSLASNLNREAYDGIPSENIPPFESYMFPPCRSSIFLEDCSMEEVKEIISDFDSRKSSDIPVTVIKATNDSISPILSKLYNNCMINGTFPDILKVGKIIPIYKKGNPENIENYRPISILPIFGKIFEKIIYNRLYSFIASKGILTECQFGFRKNHSTHHALHHSINIIKEAHHQKKHVIGIFIDLSKAFDTIDYTIMLNKLYNYGIRGVSHNLLSSYLTGRKQYTSIFGENSKSKGLMYGVPQGSILGPLLFLLYINDLINSYNDKNCCQFVLYADDTNIFIIDESREAAIKKANLTLQFVKKFMLSNSLHINLDKCCYMHFVSPFNKTQKQPDTKTEDKIEIDGYEIKEVQKVKFLGVIIDNKLSWHEHISHLQNKLKIAIGTISRIKPHIPSKHYKAIYHSLFESHMTYCISVWGGVAQIYMQKLFRLQKQCIRILFGDQEKYNSKFETAARCRPYPNQKLDHEFYCKEHTKPIFAQHEILTIQNIYTYQTCLEVAKILKNKTPISIHSLLTVSTRDNSNLLILPMLTNCFAYNASRMWNVITKTIAKSIDPVALKISFLKLSLKKSLLKVQQMHSVNDWTPANFNVESIRCI